MKILLLGSGSIGSSLSARLVSLGRSLVEGGHEVTLIVPHTDKYSDHRPHRVDTLYGMTVIHPAQLSTGNATVNLLTYVPTAAWRVLRCPADIIQIYKPTPLTIVGLVKGWSRRSRVVVDIDDLSFAVMTREGHHPARARLVRWSETIAARGADAVVTASSYLQSTFHVRYPNKPVVWIPNGVQGIVDQPNPQSDPSLVFIGSLNAGGGAAQLIEALPHVLTAVAPLAPRVTVIGDGTERNLLEDRAAELGLTDAITFTSWVPHERLKDHVPPGSLGVCCPPDTAAARAASNQKVFDYLSLGAVPVVTRVGDLPFYVDYGRSGYIVDDDLAATLSRAVIDTAGRIERVEAGRLYLEARFLWSTLARNFETVYSSLVPHLAGAS